ncbi:hypothetical protein K438DRAFT_1971553 [Mycena galopus ATCC 62051]|nr:hypothetical protein K438DRAFT_1971553 [Mycena galopus ATCC 62051]
MSARRPDRLGANAIRAHVLLNPETRRRLWLTKSSRTSLATLLQVHAPSRSFPPFILHPPFSLSCPILLGAALLLWNKHTPSTLSVHGTLPPRSFSLRSAPSPTLRPDTSDLHGVLARSLPLFCVFQAMNTVDSPHKMPLERLIRELCKCAAEEEQTNRHANWMARGRIHGLTYSRGSYFRLSLHACLIAKVTMPDDSTVVGYILVERVGRGTRMQGVLSMFQSLPARDQGVFGNGVPTGSHTDVVTLDLSVPLTPVQFLAVALAVSERMPRYTLLGTNCYWFCLTVLETIRTADAVPAAPMGNRVGLYLSLQDLVEVDVATTLKE